MKKISFFVLRMNTIRRTIMHFFEAAAGNEFELKMHLSPLIKNCEPFNN